MENKQESCAVLKIDAFVSINAEQSKILKMTAFG